MARCLIDTNILLRLSRRDDPQYALVQAALDELDKQGTDLCFAMQNIVEFWNVCTRPIERNGVGLSVAETDRSVEAIERAMTLLPDDHRVYFLASDRSVQ
jgi:predicted nucleic acid-binding protein